MWGQSTCVARASLLLSRTAREKAFRRPADVEQAARAASETQQRHGRVRHGAAFLASAGVRSDQNSMSPDCPWVGRLAVADQVGDRWNRGHQARTGAGCSIADVFGGSRHEKGRRRRGCCVPALSTRHSLSATIPSATAWHPRSEIPARRASSGTVAGPAERCSHRRSSRVATSNALSLAPRARWRGWTESSGGVLPGKSRNVASSGAFLRPPCQSAGRAAGGDSGRSPCS